MSKCSFEGCEGKYISGVSERLGYCVFHAPVEAKGISDESFIDRIKIQIENNDFDFSGYIFPCDIDFSELIPKKIVEDPILFYNSEFHGSTKFNGISFNDISDFQRSKFFGSIADFSNTRFLGDALFRETDFSGGNVFFTSAQFLGTIVNFARSNFGLDAVFSNNVICCPIRFTDINLSRDSRFYFINPEFKVKSKAIIVTFTRVRFNPYAAHFEFIKFSKFLETMPELNQIPIIVFRFCTLNNAYFVNCEMRLFSFFGSADFENAIFVSNNWPKYKRRENVAFEEIYIDDLKRTFEPIDGFGDENDPYSVRDLKDYSQIAEIYMRLKSSADRAKNYIQAGWFYYNEIEMKKTHRMKSKSNKLKILLYQLYKIFAGYGEKPSLSFAWFSIFTVIFTVIHLLNGIRIPKPDGGWQPIQYCLKFSKEGLNTFFPVAFGPMSSRRSFLLLTALSPRDICPV